jgi:Fe-S cluster biogenesis protein NfuA
LTQETLENVEKALSEIHPFLESDGGKIDFVFHGGLSRF